MTTHALRFENNRGQDPNFAPQDGRQTYGFPDLLGAVHYRMSRALQQEDVLQRLEYSAGIKSGYRTNLRGKIVAERAERMSIKLNNHTLRLKERAAETGAQESRLLNELAEHRKSKQDFLRADSSLTLEQNVLDDVERCKAQFVEAFDLPPEVLDPKSMEDFRRLISSGGIAGPVPDFNTTDPKCRSALNNTLGLQSQGSSWPIEQVIKAIAKLDDTAAKANTLAEQLATVTEKAERLEGANAERDIEAERTSRAEAEKSMEEVNRMAAHLGEANGQMEALRSRVAEVESQLNDTVEAKEKAEKKLGDVETQLRNKSAALESIQHTTSNTDLENAEEYTKLRQELSGVRQERDSLQSQLMTEQEEHRQLQTNTITARQDMEAVKARCGDIETQRDDMRRQWVALVQAIADTYRTGKAIAEHVLRPLMFIVQRGPGVTEITSDDLQPRTPSGKQIVAVDLYQGFEDVLDSQFDALRMLQVILKPVGAVSDVIWLEQHAIPKVIKEFGVQHGRASTYVLVLYLAMQERFLSATGLVKAIAASALAQLHACFPLENTSQWVGCVQGLVQGDHTHAEKPLLDQASFARLLATLGEQVQTVQCSQVVRRSIFNGDICVEHSIPQILITLVKLDARGPVGHTHVVVDDSLSHLIAVDDGGEECIFVRQTSGSWICCKSGFEFSHEGKLLEVSCAALPGVEWTAPELNNYVKKSLRYSKTVARMKLAAVIQQGQSMNADFRRMLSGG